MLLNITFDFYLLLVAHFLWLEAKQYAEAKLK